MRPEPAEPTCFRGLLFAGGIAARSRTRLGTLGFEHAIVDVATGIASTVPPMTPGAHWIVDSHPAPPVTGSNVTSIASPSWSYRNCDSESVVSQS